LGVAFVKRIQEQAIKLMDKASEAILALQPVTFRYKKDFDPGRHTAIRPWSLRKWKR
jgi:hypothetical protein